MILDRIDKKIIKELAIDAKIPNNVLSEKIGLSLTPLIRRIKKLEHFGVIQKYEACINYAKLGYQIKAVCHVSLKNEDANQIKSFKDMIDTTNEVQSYYVVTGSFTFILFIIVKNIQEYEKLISNKILSFSGIRRIESSIIMTQKEKQFIDIE